MDKIKVEEARLEKAMRAPQPARELWTRNWKVLTHSSEAWGTRGRLLVHVITDQSGLTVLEVKFSYPAVRAKYFEKVSINLTTSKPWEVFFSGAFMKSAKALGYEFHRYDLNSVTFRIKQPASVASMLDKLDKDAPLLLSALGKTCAAVAAALKVEYEQYWLEVNEWKAATRIQ
jgi:hypothetical protein